jgi:hypothetical protein
MLCETLSSTKPPDCQPAKRGGGPQTNEQPPIVTAARLVELMAILERTIERRRRERGEAT